MQSPPAKLTEIVPLIYAELSHQLRNAHHASIINPKEIGDLLRTINEYNGYLVTKCALQLAPLLFF